MNTDTIKNSLMCLTLCVSLCFGAFLFDPTNRPLKYLLLALSVATVFWSNKQSLSRFAIRDYFDFIFPWLPWFICIFISMFIHRIENFYVDSFLLLTFLFLALRKSMIRQELVYGSIGLTLLIVSASIVIQVVSQGNVETEILQVNKNVLVPSTTLLTVVCIALLLFKRNLIDQKLQLLLVCAVLLSLVAIVVSEVRTSLLAILSLIPLVLLKKRQNILKYVLFICCIFGLLFALFWFTGRMQEGVSDLLKYQTGNSNTSWGIRLELWKLSFNAFLSKPLFGWGQQPFGDIIAAGFSFPVKTFFPKHFHSDIFNILVCCGLLGIIGWTLTICLLIKKSWNDPVQLALLLACLAMGLTERIMYQNRVSIYLLSTLWVLIYLVNWYSHSNQSHFKNAEVK